MSPSMVGLYVHVVRGLELNKNVLWIKAGPKPRGSVHKSPTYQNDFGNSDRCKREYRQHRTCVVAVKWGVGVTHFGLNPAPR